MGRCLADGCSRQRKPSEIFCKQHWFALPKPMRDEIWEAHRTNNREASLTLIREAVKYLGRRWPKAESSSGS